MTPDAVIYRYLQLVAPAERNVDQLCLLLSADADLLTRWLKLLNLPADLNVLRDHMAALDDEEFNGLAQSQAWAVLPIAGSARLSLDQWMAVLRAACLAEVLADHFSDQSAEQQASTGAGEDTRLRALLAISGVHLPQDEVLSSLIEFRGTNPALLEDASLELRIFAVVDAMEVGREVELARDLLGLSTETFTGLLEAAEAASVGLVRQLAIDLNSDVDWNYRIWLRQQISIMGVSFRLCGNLDAFNTLHKLVSRCLFAAPGTPDAESARAGYLFGVMDGVADPAGRGRRAANETATSILEILEDDRSNNSIGDRVILDRQHRLRNTRYPASPQGIVLL